MTEGSRQHFCENCGTKISPTDNFCANCGAAQKSDQQGVGQPERLPQDGMVGGARYFYRKTPPTISTKWVAIIVVVILLLSGGVAWALQSGHTPWSGPPQSTPPTSEQTATRESSTPSGQTAGQGSSTSSEQTTGQESSTPSEQAATSNGEKTAASNDEKTTTASSSDEVAGVPAGYVLEDCQQGVGATGKTIYYRAPLPPQEGRRMHAYWFECVHRKGDSPVVNVVSSPSTGGKPQILGSGGPYCTFSTADMNIGCALEQITEEDLMNPPTKDNEDTAPSQQQGQTQQTSPSTNGSCVSSNDKYYTNSEGSIVQSPTCPTNGTVPAGATAQCADGSYSFSQSRRGTCSSYGGVYRWLVPISSLKP